MDVSSFPWHINSHAFHEWAFFDTRIIGWGRIQETCMYIYIYLQFLELNQNLTCLLQFRINWMRSKLIVGIHRKAHWSGGRHVCWASLLRPHPYPRQKTSYKLNGQYMAITM